MKKIMLAALVMTAPLLASAQGAVGAVFCKRADDDSIGKVLAYLEKANQIVPNVPPEEARYLTKETEFFDALYSKGQDTRNPVYEKRWQLLTERPYYNVWLLRDDLESLIQGFQMLPTMSFYYGSVDTPEAAKLNKSFDLEHHAYRYLDSVKEFRINRANGLPILIPSEQIGKLYGDALAMTSFIVSYQRCKLAKLK